MLKNDITNAIAAGGQLSSTAAYVLEITGLNAGSYVFIDGNSNNVAEVSETIIQLSGLSDTDVLVSDFI